ncbi:hypothetical protein QFC21_005330 [Naganishia friedmannii]|uniref:Uncharacterized protein n=1 Tax=Naganishia friedmannii TaxID=89922 RepID=A0ACC2VA42_9TREE|nr:hypothetical protein QFC21_005330 [Naganishia friedmannii]
MAKSKVITKKQQKKQQQGGSLRRKETAQDQSYTVPQLIEQAHNLLAQQHFEQAIRKLDHALALEPENREARELAGIAECEEGDVEKGRAHLQQLISQPAAESTQPPASASPYLYLAQTALSPQEALQHYESALQVLQRRLESMTSGATAAATGNEGMSGIAQEQGEEETEQEVRKECVMALVAMVEIWMSDLCFEPDAPTQCNTLISRALHISPDDPDALLTLASIRMSESNPREAAEIVVRVADAVLRVAERLEMKADELEKVQAQLQAQVDADADFTLDESETTDLELPPMQTRYLVTRLLLEHSDFVRALKMVDTIRGEDDEDVEGCYLEGWGWYCRGKALEDGVASAETETGDEGTVRVEECYMEALGSLMECQSLHAQQSHPDEGILAHVNELVAELEGKGVKVDVGDDDDDEGEDGEGDVEMS